MARMTGRGDFIVLVVVPLLVMAGIMVCIFYAANAELTRPIEGTVFGKEFVPEECDLVLIPVNNMLVPTESCSMEEYYLKIREDGTDIDVPIRVTREDFSKHDFGDRYSR